MATLIKNANIANDSWQRLETAVDGGLPLIPAQGDVLVPLALWQAASGTLLGRSAGRVGVWLAPMGLGNAFNALKVTLAGVWQSLPESTVTWAFALILAVTVFAFDGLRSILTRLK